MSMSVIAQPEEATTIESGARVTRDSVATAEGGARA